ncbi:MAG: AAA family ATPase, partial [Muribaculaceae bacterium]|nr:AAA family ATPase [Muribaculaceae bacterium]
PDTNREDMILMYGFVPKGGSLVICGPTNAGKTTFNIQLALQLVTGKCDCPLAPNPAPVKPQNVLLFSTEQSKKKIKHDYKALSTLSKRYPNFKVETEGVSPEEIFAKVKLHLETADNQGIVIVIDNYTKLVDAYGESKVKWMDRKLEELRRKNENIRPVTIIKVVHTNKKYKEYNPVDIQHIDGKAGIANFTHNLIFLTSCGKGHDYRILKERKNKIDGTKDTVSILKYAGTDPHQFVYDGEAVEGEVLPPRPTHKAKDDGEDANNVAPGKRGRKEKYSVAELAEMQEEFKAGFNWREILESRGFEYSKDKARGIKEAMKRHKIRA